MKFLGTVEYFKIYISQRHNPEIKGIILILFKDHIFVNG
jgi:hypothetical protein